jgi:hypothetical protein
MIKMTNFFQIICVFSLCLHKINAYTAQSRSPLALSSKINRQLFAATTNSLETYTEKSVFTVSEKSAQTKESLKSQILQLGASLDRGQVYMYIYIYINMYIYIYIYI